MRVKRQKNFRRSLRFYRLAHEIQAPYKVVVDGTFLTQSLQNKIHVREQLPKVVCNDRVTPMVTNCVLAELRALGDRGRGAAFIAKGYYRVKCGHHTEIGAAACIKEQIGTTNERKLMVATQDIDLVTDLRKIPGVPLIRLNMSVPYLEEPSTASKAEIRAAEKTKILPQSWELAKLPALQQKEALAAAQAEKPKKKKGPSGANPLSCLSSKKKAKVERAAAAAAAATAAAAAAAAVAEKPKRTRSRRMGTVTRSEAEERSRSQGGPGSAAAGAAGEAARKTDASSAARPARTTDAAKDDEEVCEAVQEQSKRSRRR
mmetsp:Transcript_50532/g.145056  ORF Transcript_50532/g.145056 Transcript_50532/m.145056 type:complete len:317 (-) Transcript_50532:43-993(-)